MFGHERLQFASETIFLFESPQTKYMWERELLYRYKPFECVGREKKEQLNNK